MIRRTSILALELMAALIGIAVIALAVMVWRLGQGPISLAFATPYIERALSVEQSAVEVKIQQTDLIWAGWDQAFDIRVNNAAILGGGGKVLATLPEVSIGFSIAALFRGVVAPKRLEIQGLSATVERAFGGEIVMGFFSGSNTAADREFVREIPSYLSKLTETGEGTSAFGYLEVVRVRDVDVRYIDRVNGTEWHAPDTDFELSREADGLEAIASMGLEFGDRLTRMTAHAVFASDRPEVDVAIEFKQLFPADFAQRIPVLRQMSVIDQSFSGQLRVLLQHNGTVNSVAFDLKGVGGTVAGNIIADANSEYDITVNLAGLRGSELATVFPEITPIAKLDALIDVKASGRIGPKGEVRRLELEARSGAGSFQFQGRLPKPVEFERLTFKLNARDDFAVTTISNGAIDLGGPKLNFEVSAYRLGDVLRSRVDTVLTDLKMSGLKNYWPAGVGEAARQWTTHNIATGHVDEGLLGLVLETPLKNLSESKIQSISGSLKYSNLIVGYFEGFPKVTEVGGTASFSRDRFDLEIARGKLVDVEVDRASVNMSRLDTDSEQISIDLVLRGPLSTALAIANRKPLNLVGEIGIDPVAVGGEMAAQLSFRFPLRSDVNLEDVSVISTANLRNVRMDPGPFGFDLTNSDLELRLTDSALQIGGQVVLNGVPLSVDWQEMFNAKNDFRSRYIMSGSFDGDTLHRLGLPKLPFLGGRGELNLILTQFSDGRSEVLASGDLKQNVISLPQIGWLKPANDPGTIRFGATFLSDGTAEIQNLNVVAGDLELEATGVISAGDNRNWRAEFSKFNIGKTNVFGHFSQLADGSYLLDVEGGTLDIEPFLFDGAIEAREAVGGSSERGEEIFINLKLDSVQTSVGAGFGSSEAQLRLVGGHIKSMALDAALPESGKLRVNYGPADDGHILEVRSNDAGQALSALGWSDNLEGGALVIDGRRKHKESTLAGSFRLSKYKVSRAPALARLLQVASLTGIFAALQRGLEFESFDGTFSYKDDVVQVYKSRTYGSSIGITVEGSLDLAEDAANLQGTIVPAYTVNRVLGQIPILGPILTGGKDEGVFAASYAVNGPLEDPTIAVNPLSALAPGFLRNLFDLIGSGGKSGAAPAATESATQ